MKKTYYIIVLLALLFTNCKGDTPDNEKIWKVIFASNGGSFVNGYSNIIGGSTIKAPTPPTKADFTFDGWYTDNATFANKWDFDKNTVIGNLTLYAKWIALPKTWTVTFNSNGGTAINPLKDVANGTKITKPTDPTKTKFVFGGWFTDNFVFQNEWNFLDKTVDSNVTVYAKWTPQSGEANVYDNTVGLVPDCADPYILKYDGKYYLYGTGGADGIKVYQSTDMVKWSTAVGARSGYALHKNDVWGEKWFWAPEVYFLNNKFYMFFSAEEENCVAVSTSPLGPFVQASEDQKPFHTSVKEIDTHLFIDDDGKKYLYFVRFTNGNEIWVAELNDDMKSIKENTLTRCIGATLGLQNWEKSTLDPEPGAKVNEGPFILKHKGWYYLTYSANHYQNPNYGVGYAVATSPLGPWTKFERNPILIGNNKIRGTGHHSFLTLDDGTKYIIYHSHKSPTVVQPRKLGIDLYEFVPAANGPDTLRVNGPTTVPQILGIK